MLFNRCPDLTAEDVTHFIAIFFTFTHVCLLKPG